MRLVTAVESNASARLRNRWFAGFVMSMLAIFCMLLAGFEGHRFSYMYFMLSITFSLFAWLMYFIPGAKTHVLLCGPGAGNEGHWNVLAFDFFCRILFLSLFWYSQRYDWSGTFKPQWAEVLG
jgi:hypothetical protein